MKISVSRTLEIEKLLLANRLNSQFSEVSDWFSPT